MIYVGSGVEGYGNLILIRHANGYVSAYAHLKSMSVAKGDNVNRGDTIGAAGMTGSVSQPAAPLRAAQGRDPGRSGAAAGRLTSHRRRKLRAKAPAISGGFLALSQSQTALPISPARCRTNWIATRPERAPRVAAHSMARARSVSSSISSP